MIKVTPSEALQSQRDDIIFEAMTWASNRLMPKRQLDSIVAFGGQLFDLVQLDGNKANISVFWFSELIREHCPLWRRLSQVTIAAEITFSGQRSLGFVRWAFLDHLSRTIRDRNENQCGFYIVRAFELLRFAAANGCEFDESGEALDPHYDTLFKIAFPHLNKRY